MSLPVEPQPVLQPSVTSRIRARATLSQPRLRWATRGAQGLCLALIGPTAALVFYLAVTSDHLQRPLASGLYSAYLAAAPVLIGTYWWRRRPESRFGPLLVTFGAVAAVYGLQSADAPALYLLGFLAEPVGLWLTFFLFLAFPMGRLLGRVVQALMAAMALSIVGFYASALLLLPAVRGGGPLAGCVAGCPDNLAQVTTDPGLAASLADVSTAGALLVTVAVVVVFGARVVRASHPQRRTLVAVAVTSLLFLPAFFAFHLSRQFLDLPVATADAFGWALIATRVLLPLGFLLALWQAELFAGAALARLIRRLATRPTLTQWRDDIADCLDDAPLRIGYADARTGRFLDADGVEVRRPAVGSGRSWVPVHRGETEVAVLIIDYALAESPELVRAACAATMLTMDNGYLEGEVRASRARIVAAGNAERRRVERDLHDSAQQRLVSLRIHLSMLSEDVGDPAQHARLEDLGRQLDDALDDLRDVAHGIYPQVLADLGVAAALKAATRDSAAAVTIRHAGLERHAEAIELTVYFCCLEAVQNAVKHAGAGASTVVILSESESGVGFTVQDDGVGFDSGAIPPAAGLTNVHDRLAAVGGELRVESAPGAGTTVTGHVPFG